MFSICLALALAINQPVDLRPSWRSDFAPLAPAPRPSLQDQPPLPFGDRTGQLTLRGCFGQPEAQDKLRRGGYRRMTADVTDEGKLYERWGTPDGRWESGVADPASGLYCPLFKGPGWLYFVPADR